jgi:CubicO group peptidase (beta-lactamase class C family)
MKLKLFAIVLVVVSLAAAAPQAQIPDTPAAHQFAAWLEAFNSGDRAKLLEFLQRNNPSHAGEIDGELGFRRMTGGFKFMKLEESTATRLSGIVRERESDTFAHFALEVEAVEPYRITKFDLEQIPIPAEFAPPRLSQADTIAALKADMDKRAAEDKYSGAVLIAKDGKPVFTAAYGMADREKKIPNRLDTQFRIGSMNKMFTAVSVLQLVQAGKIKLTDPLGKYLTDYPNKDVASKVTIHHLLTHTGGTGDFFGPEFDKHRLELRALRDYVKLFGPRGLEFEPGSKWDYSNYGFLLLGVLIERVSGQSYYDYVAEHVYKPAGMTLTASLAEDQVVPSRSVGYTHRRPPGAGDGAAAEEWRPNTDTLPYRGTSAGGGYSTVGDLLRFANALESHKLLDAEHTELLVTGKVDTGGGEKYAYGFGDRSYGGMQCFGHGGGAPGMNGDLEICPGPGYVLAVLSNLDPPAAQRVTEFVLNRLPEK